MANPSKNKGTAAETAVVRWARTNGFPGADRQPLRGTRDAGDINLCPGIVLEVKNHRTAGTGQPSAGQLGQWMFQAALERNNAGAAHCPLVVKRAGTTDVGRWFAYLPLGELVQITGGPHLDDLTPICLPVTALFALLRVAGYGTPIEIDAAAS